MSSDLPSPLGERLWEQWLEEEWPVLVRAANQRYWLWRGTWGTAHQIARALPLKHRGWLRRGHDKEVSFGITRAYLPRRPDKPLWMRVVRHGKREPLVLVTTRLVRGRHQSARLIQSYLDRWACEEGYRLTKHGVQTRRMTTLQSLVALAGLAWVLLRPIPIVLAANRTKLAGKNKKTLCFHFIQSVGLLAEAVRCCQDDLSSLAALKDGEKELPMADMFAEHDHRHHSLIPDRL